MKTDDFLIERLLIENLVNDEQVSAARAQSKDVGVVDTLVEQGILTEKDVAITRAKNFGMEYVPLDEEISADVIKLIPSSIAHQYQMIPVRLTPAEAGAPKGEYNRVLTVVSANPLDFDAASILPHFTDASVIFSVATESAIKTALQRYYSRPN